MIYKDLHFSYWDDGYIKDIQLQFMTSKVEWVVLNAKLHKHDDLLYFWIWQWDDENDDLFSMISGHSWYWDNYLDDNSDDITENMWNYCMDVGLEQLWLKEETIQSLVNFIF